MDDVEELGEGGAWQQLVREGDQELVAGFGERFVVVAVEVGERHCSSLLHTTFCGSPLLINLFHTN